MLKLFTPFDIYLESSDADVEALRVPLAAAGRVGGGGDHVRGIGIGAADVEELRAVGTGSGAGVVPLLAVAKPGRESKCRQKLLLVYTFFSLHLYFSRVGCGQE